MKKNIILLILFISIFGLIVILYLWNKPHENIANEDVFISTSAKEILIAFQNNEDSTWQKLGNKAVEISGKVLQSYPSYISLDVDDINGGVICYFDSNYIKQNIIENNYITIKGYVRGYDSDLLQELKIKNTIIVNLK